MKNNNLGVERRSREYGCIIRSHPNVCHDRQEKIMPLESQPLSQAVLAFILIFTCALPLITYAKQPEIKHVYRQATLEEAKAAIETFLMPRIQGLSGEYYTLDLNSTKGVEAIRVDDKDMVVLVYVIPPPVNTTFIYVEGGEKKGIVGRPNGFFFSSVNLASINSKIDFYMPSGLTSVNFVPKGSYTWHLTKDGVFLNNRDGYGGYIIYFEEPLPKPLPESVLCVAPVSILDNGKGFQFGPVRWIYLPTDATDPQITFIIRLRVYDKVDDDQQ